MNAQGYRKLGREMGLMGLPLDEQDKVSNSWQARAYRLGHAGGTAIRNISSEVPAPAAPPAPPAPPKGIWASFEIHAISCGLNYADYRAGHTQHKIVSGIVSEAAYAKLVEFFDLEHDAAMGARGMQSGRVAATKDEIELARAQYAKGSDDDIEVDDDAMASHDPEEPQCAWVQAWVYVRKPDGEEEGESDNG